MIQWVFFVWLGLWLLCLVSEVWQAGKDDKK